MAEIDDKQEHFEWLVKSRTRNQNSALHLRRIFKVFPKRFGTKELSPAAQELTSVTFSLWRAAFLSDKTGGRSVVFSHACTFLDKIIEDNAISYVQDKKSNEWTFNYYTKAARFSLEYLHKRYPGLTQAYKVSATRRPKERWEYCQELLESSIHAFEDLFEKEQEIKAASVLRRKRKASKTKNRATVRKMQLTEKK